MMHCFRCEMSLALTYAMAHTDLAIHCAKIALNSAEQMQRPDLAAEANELLAVLRRFA